MEDSTRPAVQRTAQPSTSNDRPFNPFRTPLSEAAKAVVADVTRQIESYEGHRKPRKRARKATDQTTFEQTIAAVVCDLTHRYCEDPAGNVAISLSNGVLGRKSRYRPSVLGKTLPALLEHLSAPEMDFVEIDKGGRREEMGEDGVLRTVGRQTTIHAGPKLVRRIKDRDLSFSDLGVSEAEEIIVLKAEKIRGEDGELLDYEDTPATRRYRSDLRAINEWLAKANLDVDQLTNTPTDTSARRLRRIFNNGSFTRGGRLYGGFWMNMKKEVRRNDLIIEGEQVAELDYGQMNLRLLYGKAGASLPEGDLYSVPGLPWRVTCSPWSPRL